MTDTLTTFIDEAQDAIPISVLTADQYEAWRAGASAPCKAWLKATGFTFAPGKIALLPNADGGIDRVLLGVGGVADRWMYAALPGQLPQGRYRLENLADDAATDAALGWGLAYYRFDRYRTMTRPTAQLVWPQQADRDYVLAAYDAIAMVRDLVNTPANDMGPVELAAAAVTLANQYEAKCRVIGGAELAQEYPAVHAVGKGSPRGSCLIDFTWGDPADPKVTLVGKGVTFDTGGLDIKPAGGMQLMKKDMGGAAHALGLASLIMQLGLKLRLRVLIPAVENATSGEAMRPLDVINTRLGLTVEIGDTDAEGRLILADALAEASAETPALIFDFATLTGAARVALGPEIPPFFCNDDGVAEALAAASKTTRDPIWRLPLYQPYAADLDGKVADISNITGGGFAGAMTAALFLEKFVQNKTKWAHFDVYAWNPKSRPGRPEGGEAFALHACFAVLKALSEK